MAIKVLTRSDDCEFILQVKDAGGEGGEALFFGVVDTVPTGLGKCMYLPPALSVTLSDVA